MPARVVSSNGTAGTRAQFVLRTQPTHRRSAFLRERGEKIRLPRANFGSHLGNGVRHLFTVKSEPARSDSVNEFNMRIGLRF